MHKNTHQRHTLLNKVPNLHCQGMGKRSNFCCSALWIFNLSLTLLHISMPTHTVASSTIYHIASTGSWTWTQCCDEWNTWGTLRLKHSSTQHFLSIPRLVYQQLDYLGPLIQSPYPYPPAYKAPCPRRQCNLLELHSLLSWISIFPLFS